MQFTMVTPKEILTHLMTTYGKIRDRDLDQNLENITRPWDPDTNIELVFSNGKLCRELAEEGGNPISDGAYIRMLLKVFRQSSVFNTKIRSWTALPNGDKTLPKFKAHFIEAYENRRDESLQATLLTANTVQATTAGHKHVQS